MLVPEINVITSKMHRNEVKACANRMWQQLGFKVQFFFQTCKKYSFQKICRFMFHSCSARRQFVFFSPWARGSCNKSNKNLGIDLPRYSNSTSLFTLASCAIESTRIFSTYRLEFATPVVLNLFEMATRRLCMQKTKCFL